MINKLRSQQSHVCGNGKYDGTNYLFYRLTFLNYLIDADTHDGMNNEWIKNKINNNEPFVLYDEEARHFAVCYGYIIENNNFNPIWLDQDGILTRRQFFSWDKRIELHDHNLNFNLFCPVDISITDPDGHIINKVKNEITGASYTEPDLDGDNDPDVMVIIPDKIPGKYHIVLTPKPGVSPTETFTLKVSLDGNTKAIADDVAIKDIPTQQYEIEVTSDGQIIVTGDGGTSIPEFPSIFLPATMIIGFLGAVLLIQRTREH